MNKLVKFCNDVLDNAIFKLSIRVLEVVTCVHIISNTWRHWPK